MSGEALHTGRSTGNLYGTLASELAGLRDKWGAAVTRDAVALRLQAVAWIVHHALPGLVQVQRGRYPGDAAADHHDAGVPHPGRRWVAVWPRSRPAKAASSISTAVASMRCTAQCERAARQWLQRGPLDHLPIGVEARLPWHGQSQLRSAGFPLT